MKTSWVIAVFTLFITLSLISGILELQYLSASADQEAVFERLMTPPSFTSLDPLSVLFTVVLISWHYILAFWQMLTFDYAFFTGAWSIIRWAIFLPISVGMVFSFISLLRGTSST